MEEEDLPPFTLQSTEGRRLRRQASAASLDPGVIYLLLLVTALAFGFRATQLIKIIWESLNLVSVLLAVLCVFLGKNHGGEKKSGSQKLDSGSVFNRSTSFNSNRDPRRESSKPRNDKPPPFNDDEHWRFDGADSDSDGARARSEPPQEAENYDERRRFHDDDYFPGHSVDSISDHRRGVLFPATAVEQQQNVKINGNNERRRLYDDIDAYLYGCGTSSSSDQAEDVLFPPPSKQPEVKFEQVDLGVNGVFQKPIPSAPPLPESPPPSRWYEEKNSNAPPNSAPLQPAPIPHKTEKRRAKNLWAPFRKKKKKKKQIQREKSVENIASLFDPQSSFYQSSIPPPSRTNRESRTSVEAAKSKNKPPKPARTTAFSAAEMNIESGNSSPLSSIPPSPPAPPFGVVPWRFEWHGDLVRAASFTSSMCGSSDLDGAEPPGKKHGNGESTSAPSSCSSPDVNVKAGNFIASFRADLVMQKMNSQKARLNSRAGPGYDDLGRGGPT